MNIKICGITNLEDALLCCQLGTWALGFNFYPASPRYIRPQVAKSIITQLPAEVVTVGIFIDQPLQHIFQLKKDIGLHFLQVYEHYPCSTIEKQQMILTIQPSSSEDLPTKELLRDYAMILIDAPRSASCVFGGSGKYANWEVAKQLTKEFKLILAGGIQATNIQAAIKQVHPFAIDLCSGVEQYPGKKDLMKLHSFFSKVSTDVDLT